MQEKDIKAIQIKIGMRVRSLCKEQHTNYEVFEKQHGINKVTLVRIESGQNASIKSIIIVAEALNVELGGFLKICKSKMYNSTT